MVQFKKRVGEEEEEIGLLLKRKRKKEPEVERKLDGNRFPRQSDGSPALGFATLSHSNIKSLAKLAKAQGHNTRAIETPNAREDAPEPIELLEEKTGSYRDRLKAVLDEHEVPFHFRRNGTIATEDVFGASPEYWNRDGDWKQKPIEEIINDPVVQACLALARRKHGKKLISCSLHADEESPHIHVVAVPLVQRLHARRGRKPKDCPIGPDGKPIDPRPLVKKYSLDVTSERGLSRQLERNHDEWADACKDIGLVRGERGSDMTEEQRRARRNRQTGRASMAEKHARQQRELIILDAQMGAVVIVDDAIKERDRIIDEAMETIDRVSDETRQENERTKKLLEEAEAAKKEAEVAKAEAERMKLAQADRELQLSAELANAQEDRKAAAAELAKTKKARLEMEARETELADQLSAVAGMLKPGSPNKPVIIDGELHISGAERTKITTKYRALPRKVRDSVRQLLVLVTELDQAAATLKSAQHQLHADLQKLEAEKASVDKVIASAREFQTAWLAIPEGERLPAIQATINAGKGLTTDDLPPGFTPPGRSGPSLR